MSQPVDQLINEIRVFYQSLVQLSEQLHGDSQISIGMRAVLEYLLNNGPSTVPTIAAQRRVSRQRIQTLVNQLMQLSLVEVLDNPASKRSPLIALSTLGRRCFSEMTAKELGLLKAVEVSDQEVQQAYQTIVKVRLSMEAKAKGDS